MKCISTFPSAMIVFGGILFQCFEVCATGFRLPDQDAAATARAEAFAATADNPSAIYYNPAGIAQLKGHHVRGGVYGLYIDATYNGQFKNEKDLHAVPQMFYTYSPYTLPIAFGLGIYSPYGLSSKWPQDTGFRTIATEGKLTYMTLNPVVAWQPIPTLSIAAGPTISYSEIDLQQGVLSPVPNSDLFRFKGDDVLPGFNLGLLWKAHPKLQFGATYRSATDANYEGSTEAHGTIPPPYSLPFQFKQNASAGLAFPQSVVLGISYRPTPVWNLEFNADWTDWDRLDTVTIHQAAPYPPLFPQDIHKVLRWKSSFYYEFGVTRSWDNGWAVSAGYIFNENSVPDDNYQPLVSDLDRHFFSIGANHTGQHWEFSAAYQFGYAPTRTVTGSAPSAIGQTADGRYEFQSHALFVSLGYKF